jgi:choice-of-anchor C domain-containing protein
VLLGSVCFALTAGFAQEVPVNRSFEEGEDPGEMTVLSPGSKAIVGWTVVGGNVSYVGGKWKAAQGDRSVGLLCGGGISQTLRTDPTQKYDVRFSMAGDPNAQPAVKSVVVSFGKNSRTFTFDTTGHSPTEMGWDGRSWIFEAEGETTTLSFSSPQTQCSTPAIDSVRVVGGESAVEAQPIEAPVTAGRDAPGQWPAKGRI